MLVILLSFPVSVVEIILMVSKQDVPLHAGDDLCTMAEDKEVMLCKETALVMTFLAGKQDPNIGTIKAIKGNIYSLGNCTTFDIVST